MALLLAVLRVLASAAFARAGGGHSFHSGGSFHSSGGSFHSSGGGYGGGGGSFTADGADGFIRLIFYWIELTFTHPVMTLPVNCVLGYFAYRVYFVADDYRVRRTIADGLEAQDDASLSSNVAALVARDPNFALPAFLQRVEASFLAIQAAWSAMDMTPARALVSDGVMERFTLQLGMLKAQGLRNDMQAVRVIEMKALQFESSSFWDSIHVAIEASAVDRDIRITDGAVMRDGGEDSFIEVWTFVRRPGAKTLAGRGALEGQCPNCGSPLQLIDSEQCASCKSWLNSGEFDWVLSEITQESEWSAREPGRDVPGLSALALKDPALNTLFLEDRASVAFWRRQEALFTGKTDPLRPVAADAYCEATRTEAESNLFFREAAIGAVITLACETGPDMDRVHVVVRWSGERCHRTESSFSSDGDAYYETVFTLARRSGVTTDAKAGLRSLRCASCGAPPRSREAAACEYCSRPFNDGSRQWVLVETKPASAWRMPQGLRRGPPNASSAPEPAPAPAAAVPAPKPVPASAAPAGPEERYAWTGRLTADASLRVMTAAMMADGQIDREEQRYLVDFARSHGVAPETVGALVQAYEEGRLELPVPQSTEESCAFLRGLVIMSLADGAVGRGERRAIDACAAALDLKPADVDELIARERQAMYDRAKAALAARKQAA